MSHRHRGGGDRPALDSPVPAAHLRVMTSGPTTPDEIKSLLVTILADATGSARERWHALVKVELRVGPPAPPRPNWGVVPQGNAEERIAISRAVCLVRDEFPRLGQH